MASVVRACAGGCGRFLRLTPNQAEHLDDQGRFCETCRANAADRLARQAVVQEALAPRQTTSKR